MFNNKIVHIFQDDKFVDPAVKLFEANRSNISVYIVIKHNNDNFKLVQSKLVKGIVVKNEEDLFSFISRINESNAKGVFFHSLNPKKINIVNHLNKDKIKVWFIWGSDLYGTWKILSKNIYTKSTKTFLKKHSLKTKVKNEFIFNNFSFNLYLKSTNGNVILPKSYIKLLKNNFETDYYRALKKMDIIAPVLPNEYEIVKKMGLKATYAPFNYVCIEDLLGDNLSKNVLNAQNILLGNSADPSNNHIDIFKRLSKIDLQNRKVYVPLSYGGNSDYIDNVIKRGERYLGVNFVPLTALLSSKKYNKILLSCNTVIFNHLRQQGIGNLIITGYLGAKIFLNTKSPTYSYYKNLGMTIFDTNLINTKSLNSKLNEDEVAQNKNILLKLYSFNAVQNKIDILFDEVLNTSK